MADTKILKNKIIAVFANTYGDTFIRVYKKKPNKSGYITVEEVEADYKFDGYMEGVDLEVGIPEGKRKEYAKIIKI